MYTVVRQNQQPMWKTVQKPGALVFTKGRKRWSPWEPRGVMK